MMLKQLFDQQQAQFALEPLFGQLDHEEQAAEFPQLKWIIIVLLMLLLMLLFSLPDLPQKIQQHHQHKNQPKVAKTQAVNLPKATPACQTVVAEPKIDVKDLICKSLLTEFESYLSRWSASLNCHTLTLRLQNPEIFFF